MCNTSSTAMLPLSCCLGGVVRCAAAGEKTLGYQHLKNSSHSRSFSATYLQVTPLKAELPIPMG